MPISVSCACGIKLQAPDTAAGKGVKCPKCAAVVKVPPGAARVPAKASPVTAAKPASARAAPVKAAPIKPVSGLKAPAPADDNELDMLEEVNEKPLPGAPAKKLVACQVPEHLKDKVEESLTSGEIPVWVGQAVPKVALIRSLYFIFIGGFFILLGCGISIGMGIGAMKNPKATFSDYIPALLPLIFAVVGAGISLMPLFKFFFARKSCYIITNKRCIVHYGGPFSSSEEYNPTQLGGMRRRKSWVCGNDAGDIVFRSVTTITHSYNRRGGHSVSSSTTYYGFLNIENMSEVERIIRETLVDRMQRKLEKLIDKLTADDDD